MLRAVRPNSAALRACLGGLRLHQTNSGAATPPICSSTVELDSPIGAEEMCLAETTTPTLKNEDLNRLPSFALIFCFACMYVMCCACVCMCGVCFLCACMCTCGRCVHAWCVGAVCVVCVCSVHGCVTGAWVCTGACSVHVCMCGVCVSFVHACVLCVRECGVVCAAFFLISTNK
jgi:hypothetical protein